MLIEVDASMPRVHDLQVELPIGDVDIKIVYGEDIKFCEHCKKVGHSKEICFTLNESLAQNGPPLGSHNQPRSRSVGKQHYAARGRSQVNMKKLHPTPIHPIWEIPHLFWVIWQWVLHKRSKELLWKLMMLRS